MPGHTEIIRGWVGTNAEGLVTSAYREDVIVFVDIPARDIYHLIWSLMNASRLIMVMSTHLEIKKPS